MREKGGLHMEKMEHMDPQRCDRIWQRVSPELDPYPEVRAACREPSREPGGREYSGEDGGCGGACCTGDTGGVGGERVLPCRQGHGQHPAHSGLHRG